MRSSVVKTGTTLEGEKTKIASSVVDVEKAKLNYREWNLVSIPKYFQINTEVIKPLIQIQLFQRLMLLIQAVHSRLKVSLILLL